MFDGKGVYKWTNGDTYIGDYLKNKKHGTGLFVSNNGDRYHGEFIEGTATGVKLTHI